MGLIDTLPLNVTTSAGRHIDMTAAALVAHGVPGAEVLAGFRGALSARIDVEAETARQRLLSPGIGQVMEYQEVRTQALAALAKPAAATAAAYPMLAATINVDIDPKSGAPATDVLGVARAAVAAYDAWAATGATIRAVRLGAKAAIRAATTLDDAEAAYAAAQWPAPPA